MPKKSQSNQPSKKSQPKSTLEALDGFLPIGLVFPGDPWPFGEDFFFWVFAPFLRAFLFFLGLTEANKPQKNPKNFWKANKIPKNPRTPKIPKNLKKIPKKFQKNPKNPNKFPGSGGSSARTSNRSAFWATPCWWPPWDCWRSRQELSAAWCFFFFFFF